MKVNLKTAQILVQLLKGDSFAYSKIKNSFIVELLKENILSISGKHHKKVWLMNAEQLKLYLSNQYNIENIETYIRAIKNPNTSRADFVKLTGDSKLSKERTFKGFLVNSYQAISAKLNSEELIINPPQGTFVFIYDFENFNIPKNVTIIGVENPRNFRHIYEQSYLFNEIEPLFISRYPQIQNKDVVRWLKQIPNKYLHFGDFDFAGINIYLSEYKKYLGDRANFFVPKSIKEDIKFGSRKRFDIQKAKFNKNEIQEADLLNLITVIEKKQKGLDQEYYIKTKHNKKYIAFGK